MMPTMIQPTDCKQTPVDSGWAYVSISPNQATTPSCLSDLSLSWQHAVVPGTVAGSHQASGVFKFGETNYDEHDYWYRCEITLPTDEFVYLYFAGLATLAEAFWNDELILSSDNMFQSHWVDMTHRIKTGVLHIRFRALKTELAIKRPRPRWKTRLVDQQQLRWLRTTLLGRIAPWSPPVAPVGPFRRVAIYNGDKIFVEETQVTARLDNSRGVIDTAIVLRIMGDNVLTKATLRAGSESQNLQINAIGDHLFRVEGDVYIENPPLWWPHTHGNPSLIDVSLVLEATDFTTVLELGKTGFRSVDVDQQQGSFTVLVNKTPIFCRGACWTPTDIIALSADSRSMRATLLAAKEAGMNMLRIFGSMLYESDEFYKTCDELGIMIWQDFMFSNMDYPLTDANFLASVVEEVNQFVSRTQLSPCIAVFCGNSDIEQQTAMLGLSKELWRDFFFAQTLPDLIKSLRPDTIYCPSSPSGGDLPFQLDASISHYYGVGAYMRPLSDARLSGVRFAAECLGFANVPEESTINGFLKDGEAPVHHPAWKSRVPRDGGAGWDFDDIRDHYTRELFSVDTTKLRYSDMTRYLALSRVSSGEVMARTIGEWRRVGSSCQGALIWWLRDLWPGAGWGLIDANDIPKAAYFYCKRAMAPVALVITDEGLNGLEIHAINETSQDIHGVLNLYFYRDDSVRTTHAESELLIPARNKIKLKADAIIGHFIDTAYAYRFGPPNHHIVTANIQCHPNAAAICEAFSFPLGLAFRQERDLGLRAIASQRPDGSWQLDLHTIRFAQSIALDIKGYLSSDNYFHLAPASSKRLILTPTSGESKPFGSVTPLNAISSIKIQIAPT